MMSSLPMLPLFAALAACASTAPIDIASRAVPAASAPGWLAMHNQERGRLGIAPLAWDEALAAQAARYAAVLAASGRLKHSPRASLPGQGENLWMGTRGAYAPREMVGSWLAERAHFRPGIFPNVSSTGNWADVGHYTQIISRRSQRVGCALASGRVDVLVCRYSPSGNVDGLRMP